MHVPAIEMGVFRFWALDIQYSQWYGSHTLVKRSPGQQLRELRGGGGGRATLASTFRNLLRGPSLKRSLWTPRSVFQSSTAVSKG